MPVFVAKLEEVTRKLSRKGIAILFLEEKVPCALSPANRVYVLEKGKIE